MPIKEKDPRFRNLEIKIGAMVLVAIAGIIILMVRIGMEKDLFTSKYRISFVSASGSGFVEGMPVKLSGFKVGRVRRIELTEDAKVKVTAEINRKYEKWIREGSKARLAKEGFIGDSYIEMTMGASGARVLSDDDTVPFEKAGGIEELVEEAKPILKEVKEIIHYVNSPEGDIKLMLGNIKDLTAEMRQTRKEIDRTVRSANRFVLDLNARTNETLDGANRSIRNVEALSLRIEPVIKRVEGIAVNADEAATRLPRAAQKIERILDDVSAVTGPLSNEAPRIKKILRDTQETAAQAKAVTKGVKESWPVRLMVPEPQAPGLVPLDSYLMRRNRK
ncbi:MAG: MCE family protein [Deltaproteobacteria bacterium]|nr:MCE family protein [Deltaproteobacteria bacterium]